LPSDAEVGASLEALAASYELSRQQASFEEGALTEEIIGARAEGVLEALLAARAIDARVADHWADRFGVQSVGHRESPFVGSRAGAERYVEQASEVRGPRPEIRAARVAGLTEGFGLVWEPTPLGRDGLPMGDLRAVFLGPPARRRGLRVTSVEVYSDIVVVGWHLRLDRDAEDLGGAHDYVMEPELVDEHGALYRRLGTPYERDYTGLAATVVRGFSQFAPAPSGDVEVLTFQNGGSSFQIRLVAGAAGESIT
jgi:hypothetical protein